ncbi:Rhamnulokinase [Arcticibacter svalbardensis MN12-7]|uniref:Rhamnulokinase n=1 Tax=Arcticibacter svalbardensis MN12-7 TaxID=1150600 RepID=R9GVI0_9SPHI|nr:rhamnulokinase family protein [Arcticibacter svalbardensis]EOR95535.1 Rhamnulokinase [Arcticibacter svalbardensis MN12-7]
MKHHFLAIDLGAESGRLILGTLNSNRLDLKEIHRFCNGMLHIRNKYYWNIGHLYDEIIKGIEICVKQEQVQPESIGIDTWGVDFGLLTKDGTLLGLPYAYRDSRTANAIEEFTSSFSKERIYELTGTLFAPYNTLFQLYAAKKQHVELLDGAANLLFIPDLLAYFLTGEKRTDTSFASTTQLYNPKKKCWEEELFSALGIPSAIMPKIVEPGSIIGVLEDEICRITFSKKIPVVAVATHDTNSAIAAIPASGDNWAFISSGTWSLMGVESPIPLLSEKTLSMNFTNESGVGDTFNILKNHMGLWLLQQFKKSCCNNSLSYQQLIEMAEVAPAFLSIIDIDDPSFLNPPDMSEAIVQYCLKTGQQIPISPGEFTRIIIESLALKYKETMEQIIEITGRSINEIYITGGGINNQLLCQYTSNATTKTVKTGLAEGSAAGNIMVQALGLGYVQSLGEMRQIIANSTDIKVYQPVDTLTWDQAYNRYKVISVLIEQDLPPLS